MSARRLNVITRIWFGRLIHSGRYLTLHQGWQYSLLLNDVSFKTCDADTAVVLLIHVFYVSEKLNVDVKDVHFCTFWMPFCLF